MLNSPEQVNQRAPKPVYSPGHHDIEFAVAGIFEHLIEARTLIAALAAANASIAIDLDNLPASTLGNLAKLPGLVLNGLAVGRNSHVNRSGTVASRHVAASIS